MASERGSKRRIGAAMAATVVGVGVGLFAGLAVSDREARSGDEAARAPGAPPASAGARFSAETEGAYDPAWEKAYPQYQTVGAEGAALKPFPVVAPGDPVPQELYRYGGRGKRDFASVDDVPDFEAFRAKCRAAKESVNAERRAYMERRYRLTPTTDPAVAMTRGKPQPIGPVTRLPEGVASWEALAALPPAEILAKDLFPEGFRPLSHPLQSTGHQLFPQMWTRAHPDHERFDVDFDVPEAFLPEFPPPMFLVTRPDLGDVSRGHEVTHANFRDLFEGILTPEQMEGLRLLVTKFPTTWFNHTKHRVTDLPSRGTACFDCHVNGHTNGAIEMDPGTRPTLARVRLETPTIRGTHVHQLFSIKRSIRSLDHFAEVEEYFDGDISLQPEIGGRQLDKPSTNRMGDFQAILAFPPAPKLDRYGRLDAAQATPAERRGEAVFHGKGRCAECHRPPHYLDDQMHDLRVEEFYPGRAEGWAKTFSLRGIKDSPPYFHDGRLLTLEDTVEFFNLVFSLRLTAEEKRDLTAFLRCL